MKSGNQSANSVSQKWDRNSRQRRIRADPGRICRQFNHNNNHNNNGRWSTFRHVWFFNFEFDIWFFASADGSGEIRARVALRGWNQLLGRGKKERGVGQRGEDVMELSEWTLLLNLLSVRSRTFKHLLSLAVQSRELQPLDYVIYYLHLLYVRCRRHGPGVINLRLKPCPYTPYAVLTQTGVRVWLCHNFVFLSGVLYICTCE